jgi:hypothetical protein
VPTSDNPAVKRRAGANVGVSPDFRENATPGREQGMHRSKLYYCIATGCELWFEKLDFDAF